MTRENNKIKFSFTFFLLIFCISCGTSETIIPRGINYYWEPVNINGGGYTNFVIVDSNSPNELYAGVNVGGIYKSNDYGEHWMPANKGLIWPTDKWVAALTIDPKSGTIYLGVGAYDKGGIFKSTDQGGSWQLLTRKVRFNGLTFKQSRGKGLIVIDPFDSQIIYAGSNKDGIFKSIDGGDTWFYIGLKDKYISSVVMNPLNSQKFYVAAVKVNKKKGGIYKSTDGGNSWKKIGDKIVDVYQLEMNPTDPDVIYAVSGIQGVFKTIDGGDTWVEKNKGLERLILSRLNLRKTMYISLAIDPRDDATIYAGSGEYRGQIYKSVNGGDTWVNLTNNQKNIYTDGWWIQKMNWPGGKSYSTNSLSVDPVDNKRIYIAGRSGLWRSDDGGITWHPKVKGLEATVMNRVVFDPKQKDVFYVGSSDWVFFYSLDGGKTILRTLDGMGNWDIKKDFDIYSKYRMKNGRDFAIDPRTTPSTVYIGGDVSKKNSGAVFKSYDGGKNWREANHGLPVAGVTALAIDLNNFDILFAALREKGIYKTVNGGKTWEAINNGLPSPNNLFKSHRNKILINPLFSNIIYVLDLRRGIYKTIDGGENWKVIGKELPERGFSGMIHYTGGLTMDYKNPETLYISLYKYGVYKTSDGGESWGKISPPYIINAGAMDIDPQDGAIYVTSVPESGEEDINNFTSGIYKSTDGGNSWQAIHNDELLKISLKINSLTVDPHHKGRIFLTTMGNGIIIGEPVE